MNLRKKIHIGLLRNLVNQEHNAQDTNFMLTVSRGIPWIARQVPSIYYGILSCFSWHRLLLSFIPLPLIDCM